MDNNELLIIRLKKCAQMESFDLAKNKLTGLGVTSKKLDAGTLILENVFNRLIKHRDDELTDKQLSFMNTYAAKDIYREFKAERKKSRKNVEYTSIQIPSTNNVDINDNIAYQQAEESLMPRLNELFTANQANFIRDVFTLHDDQAVMNKWGITERFVYNQKVSRLVKKLNQLRESGKLNFLF